MEGALLKPQKYLGPVGLLVIINALGMFVCLSTDMYLPALPQMTDYFASSATLVNLTLSVFFLMFSFGMLLLGPFSDKYGRKPILFLSLILYALSSIMCALSVTIEQLIFFRVPQGIGAGGMAAVSTALIKDCFVEQMRGKVLAVVQAMFVVGPMGAPVIGALILKSHSWHYNFWVLAALGLLCIAATMLLQEPLAPEERSRGTIAQTLGQIMVIGRNRGFLFFLLAVSIANLPFMAYIAVSSYIYIDFFSISEQAFSGFFAAAALFSVLGPIIYIKTAHRIRPQAFSRRVVVTGLISGVLMIILGPLSPWWFLLTFIPFSMAVSALRPFSTAILLEQYEADTGAVSSLINFVQTLAGFFGILLGSLPWSSYVFGLGTLIAVCSLLALIGLKLILRSQIELKKFY